MPDDKLQTILYGKTAKVLLADGKEYILREPCIDVLENLGFDAADINDIKTIKRVAWELLGQGDNPTLDKDTFGKMITLSMMREDSDFMKAFTAVLGSGGTAEKKG